MTDVMTKMIGNHVGTLTLACSGLKRDFFDRPSRRPVPGDFESTPDLFDPAGPENGMDIHVLVVQLGNVKPFFFPFLLLALIC